MIEPPFPHIGALNAGFLCRCPRCGKGRLFAGFLTIVENCDACGLDLKLADSGDGPAVFIILILGFIIVGMAMVIEVRYQPAMWIHAMIWPPLIIGAALGMLRPFKATMIALQYKHRRDDYAPR